MTLQSGFDIDARLFGSLPTLDPSLNRAGPAPDIDELFGDFLGGLGGVEDVPDPSERPVQLTGADLERFMFRFRRMYERSKMVMADAHEKARIAREVYETLPRQTEYEGEPDITVPLTANKIDGALAHIRDAMEQRPVASFSPEGIGKAAEEATQVAPLLEAWVEREINGSGSRERLVGDLPKEAVKTGTGIALLGMAEYDNENFVQIGEVVRLEDFYADRLNADSLRDVPCAIVIRQRFYTLEEWADRGLIDETNLQKLRATAFSGNHPTFEENESGVFVSSAVLEEENRVVTLLRGWMRFRPAGQKRSELYEVIVHENHWDTPLAVRLNSARHAFDEPPLRLHRIGKEPRRLLGRGLAERLRPEQEIADTAIANHLAANSLAAAPPFYYRLDSPFGQLVSQHGSGGIRPNQGIPTADPAGAGRDVEVMQFGNTGLALGDFALASELADRATYTEESLGSGDPRKTLGQFQIEVQKGTLRLRLDLADYAYDASETLRAYFAMMLAYKLAPSGVVEVQQGGKLLALDDLDERDLAPIIDEVRLPFLGQLDTSVDLELQDELGRRLTKGKIPGARRTDLTLSLTGTKIIADKVGELQRLLELTPYITALLDAATNDTYVNYHLRSIMQAMGFHDVERRMPNDPGVVLDPAQRQAQTAVFNEMQMRRSSS